MLGHVSEHSLFMFCFNLCQHVPKWRSGKTTGLRIGQYSRRARVRVPASAILFFFFFFNIHTSDKVEIFFDHSILVNGVDPWGIHRFLGGINHENGVYYMGQCHECSFYRNRVSEFWPLAIE